MILLLGVVFGLCSGSIYSFVELGHNSQGWASLDSKTGSLSDIGLLTNQKNLFSLNGQTVTDGNRSVWVHMYNTSTTPNSLFWWQWDVAADGSLKPVNQIGYKPQGSLLWATYLPDTNSLAMIQATDFYFTKAVYGQLDLNTAVYSNISSLDLLGILFSNSRAVQMDGSLYWTFSPGKTSSYVGQLDLSTGAFKATRLHWKGYYVDVGGLAVYDKNLYTVILDGWDMLATIDLESSVIQTVALDMNLTCTSSQMLATPAGQIYIYDGSGICGADLPSKKIIGNIPVSPPYHIDSWIQTQ